MNKIILAVVGLPGSGKSEAVKYLAEKTGWPSVHFGNTVVYEVVARGMEINETNEKIVRQEFREKYGMAALAIINLPKIEELFAKSSVILESFYSWEEYTFMKEKFGEDFLVLAVYASPKTREQRLVNRPFRPLTAEEMQKRDYSQIENLHQAGPIARADFTVINEGSREELCNQLDNILARKISQSNDRRSAVFTLPKSMHSVTGMFKVSKDHLAPELPKSWTMAAGILKSIKNADPVKYQQRIRKEWEARWKRQINESAQKLVLSVHSIKQHL